MTNDIWALSATETAHAVRTGQLTAAEVVRAALDRVEEVNPFTNALSEVLAEQALEAAARADAHQRSGGQLGVLHGVPLTIKANRDVAGGATTDGVLAFRDDVAERDAPVVANLRSAGAVIIGRTNTPAFSVRWFTDNEVHGRTLNPWDAQRTPGGSSGGAAAATATGMGAIAHGNDLGGSIRYPASVCGVVGLRPTVGRVPHAPRPTAPDTTLAVQLMSVEGPLARTVDDVELALEAMAAQRPGDPIQVPLAHRSGDPAGPRRVGVVRDVGVATLHPAVDETITRAAGHLSDAGYEVQEVDLSLLAEAWRLWLLLTWGMEFHELRPLMEQHGDEAIKRSAENHFAVIEEVHSDFSLDAYRGGHARRGTLVRQLDAVLQELPVLLLPTSAELPFENDADTGGVDRAREVIHAQWPLMPAPLLGLPALTVPSAVVDGLPVGVQLMARRFDEQALFRAGRVIESRADVRIPVDPRRR